MATKSRALFHNGLATLAFASSLAVIPATAGDSVALVESVTSHSQRMELMTYTHVGQVIRLSPDQTMVLSYSDSCTRETVTGGTITVGTEQSEVRSGKVTRTKGQCGDSKIELIRGNIDMGGRSLSWRSALIRQPLSRAT